MSYVIAGSGAIAAAVADLATVGSSLYEANVIAAAATTSVPAAAADQVSAAIAAFFDTQAQGYQGISAQMSALHEQLVQARSGSAASYAGAEAAAAQNLLDLINTPT
ncbi:PE family protein [Mycobacterium simiae]|uniref:PE family protein n=1 Tax=Mycobacterium simiae TaxID=1784 RepID=A0A5B1BCI2_MYCSI|nr:PE family protein [Mycobacterium simiae]KAA1245772.1 PE family protein [Mycobacterium simiae]